VSGQGACVPGNKSEGGQACKNAPSCSGDQIGCAILFQAWKARCAIEVDRDPTDADLPSSEGDPSGSDAIAAEGEDVDAMAGLNGSGWLGGSGDGSCPALPTATFMGKTFALADYMPCSALSIIGILIVFGAYCQAAYIIGGAATRS
jgi:hypothetical protein